MALCRPKLISDQAKCERLIEGFNFFRVQLGKILCRLKLTSDQAKCDKALQIVQFAKNSTEVLAGFMGSNIFVQCFRAYGRVAVTMVTGSS